MVYRKIWRESDFFLVLDFCSKKNKRTVPRRYTLKRRKPLIATFSFWASFGTAIGGFLYFCLWIMGTTKQFLLGIFGVWLLSSFAMAATPAETKAEVLHTLATQLIAEAKEPAEMEKTVKLLFLDCSLNNSDTTTKEACWLVIEKFNGKKEVKNETVVQQTAEQQGYSIREYRLDSVVDGDTIKVKDNKGEVISVRMIGIDTPESNTQRYGYIECYGEEASDHLKEILDGNQYVQIESDPTQGTYDKYWRLLGYVVLNGENINKQMIKDWYAFEYTYNLPYKYRSEFMSAENDARIASKGLWATTTCGGKRGDIKTTAANKTSSSSQKNSSTTSYKGKDWVTYIRGPRGGCYYINSNGNKSYVDHSYCSEQKEEKPTSSYSDYSSSSSSSSYSSNYIRGPRGGCFYYTNSGRKQYVDRSLCN